MDVSGGLSLVQTILQVLGSPIWTEIESVLGVKSQLEKLKVTMSTIQNVLLDAEELERRHHVCPTHVQRGRLERLKEALYQADDLFDEVATLAHRKQLMPGSRCFSCFIQLRSAFTWSGEIKKIQEMLADIVNDHQHDFGLMRHSVDLRVRHNPRETHSFVCEEDVIIGRDEDKQIVINMLLDTTVEENVSVVSIVGIGGLGKTTLARQVYNDEVILKEFPLKMWVCTSDNFDVKALVGQILAAADPEIKPGGLSVDNLQKKLRQQLDGKKYLLVLDDVWNEDPSKWLELRTLLTGGERASKIVVTTRSKKVADVVGSHCLHKTHELMGLSDEDSWKLFQRMALKPKEHPLKQQLNEVGKEIVRKCANVPLAIRVVGSLLRGQGESKWKILKNTDLANIEQDEINGIVPVLKISYNYLPFHLKSCFSYCAVFPKDYKFIKEDLIGLWMAQGFIMPSDGESFEDAGEEYFEQLLQRCFFQDVELAEGTDEILSFKMHDLIHDLAKEVAGTEILLCNYSTQCFNSKTRHVYIDKITPEVLGNLNKMKRMRTIQCDDLPFSFKSLVVEVSIMKYLRVLWLTRSNVKVSSVIGELVHLRYLDLSHNGQLCVLPSSITNLYNLQTLKLRGCWRLKGLPRELRQLVNLRHLDIYGCDNLTHMPPGMNSMTSLQKLTMFVVGGSATDDGVGQLEDLDGFTNYTRTMDIIVKKDVRYDAIGGGMLLKSQNLREIMYDWETEENNNAEVLLQGLQPHFNVRKLELHRYPGVRLPTWISYCLPNLVEIVISDCNRMEYVESSGIGGDDDKLVFFQSLEKLKVEKMAKLKGWWKPSSSESGESDRIPQAPLLSELFVFDCPNLTTFFLGSSMNLKSCLPNLAKIEIRDCKRLEHLPMMSQLRHLKVLELEELDGVEYMESSSINSGDEDELVFFPSLEKLQLFHMPKLKGWWKPSSSESGESDRIPQAPLLSELCVSNCPNLTTLFLGSSMNLKSCLPNLVKIEIRDCERLEHLPLMSKLRYLKVLKLEDLGGLEYMESSSNNISGANDDELFMFPSLEMVTLTKLPKLKGWWKSSSESESEESETPQAPKLSLLKIIIDNLAYLNCLPIRSFHHISNLLINKDQKIEELKTGEVGEVFRSGRLSSLRSLEIKYCWNLKSISGRGVWDHLTALESLSLQFLNKLELEDEDDVINNKSTEEGSDAEMPWRYLAPTLRSLELFKLSKVVKLPKGIGCLSSLQSLNILDCYNLESLTPSIGGLSSLQSLEIRFCPKLKRMPKEMRHLTSLTKLHIWGCSPELMNECNNNNGANWSNIQHIPNIKLDYK